MFPFSETPKLPILTGEETPKEMMDALQGLRRDDPLIARVFEVAEYRALTAEKTMALLAYLVVQRYYEQQDFLERLMTTRTAPVYITAPTGT